MVGVVLAELLQVKVAARDRHRDDLRTLRGGDIQGRVADHGHVLPRKRLT